MRPLIHASWRRSFSTTPHHPSPPSSVDPKALGLAAVGLLTLLVAGGSGGGKQQKQQQDTPQHPPSDEQQQKQQKQQDTQATPPPPSLVEVSSDAAPDAVHVVKRNSSSSSSKAVQKQASAKAVVEESSRAVKLKDILKRVVEIEQLVVKDNATRLNRAFVFLKPHANNEKVDVLLKDKLKAAGVVITSEGNLGASKIDEKQLIDNHYYAIASKAVLISPKDLVLTSKAKEEFKKISDGVSWEDALAKGWVYNAKEACAKLGVDGDGLEKIWAPVKGKKALVKFGGGFYCGRITDADPAKGVEPMFVINGFYMSMRGKYCTEPASIHFYTVEWDPRAMSWKEFRTNLLGSTDPAEATKGSIRRAVYDNWETLGLSAKPDTGDNGIHASASPFEATAERINWTGQTLSTDPFGRAMVLAGIPVEWLIDAQVKAPGAISTTSIFDLLEDSNADECIEKLVEVSQLNR